MRGSVGYPGPGARGGVLHLPAGVALHLLPLLQLQPGLRRGVGAARGAGGGVRGQWIHNNRNNINNDNIHDINSIHNNNNQFL